MMLAYVAVGGAFGSMMRYLVVHGVNSLTGKDYPYATLVVNVLGSFLLGLVIAWLATLLPKGRELHSLIAIGALGGFTTFSTFAVDVVLMLDKGQILSAALYVAASVIISVFALWLGMLLMRGVVA